MININNDFIENSIGFTTTKTIEETKKTITLFFHQLGYRSIVDNNQKITIKRGSKTKNGFTNNPMKWKSEITISFNRKNHETEISIYFNICTKNQMVTEDEYSIWEIFFIELEKTLITGEIDLDLFIEKNKKVTQKNINIMLWVFGGIMISSPIAFLLAIYFKTKLFLSLIMMGAILGIYIGTKRNKQTIL